MIGSGLAVSAETQRGSRFDSTAHRADVNADASAISLVPVLQRFVLVNLVAVILECALLSHGGGSPVETTIPFATVAVAGALALLWRPASPLPIAAGVVVASFLLTVTFPGSANHHFLLFWEFAVLFVLAPLGAGARVSALRWIGAGVIFWSGVQKLAGGVFWNGEYLTYLSAVDARFRAFFSFLVETGELDRLRDLARTGTVPLVPRTSAFIVSARLVTILELICPFLLLIRGKVIRLAGVLAASLLVVLIQGGAREATFSLIMLNTLSLSAPEVRERTIRFALGTYVLLILASFVVLASMNVGQLPR
jgi:hypothetical protein